MVALLFAPALQLWWTYDDFFHLRHTLTHGLIEHLFYPQTWRDLPFRMLTPLQMLSYEFDLTAFGVRPALFYAHQILALIGAVLAAYLVGRLWFGRGESGAIAFIFVCGVPIGIWAQQLMTRHYIEGLLVALIATWFFVRAVRRGSMRSAIVSAVIYGLAAAAKEIYVPLPLALVGLPEDKVRTRLRLLTPHCIVLTCYLIWRFIMLGTLLGGYGWAIRPREVPGLVFRLPVRAVNAMLLNHPIRWLLLALILACAFMVLSRGWRMAAALLWFAAILTVPLLPVSKVFEHRFAGALWLGVGFLAAVAARTLSRRGRIALLASFAALAFVSSRQSWRDNYAHAARMSEEGRFFLTMAAGELLRRPAIPPAALGELALLKQQHLQLPGGAGWFYDDLFLCDMGDRPRRVWEFDGAAVRNVTEQIPEIRRDYCSAIKWNASLRATFEKVRGKLFWDLGPYSAGSYAFVIGDGVQLYEVARKDGYQVAGLSELALRIRYTSPEGWTTYSPELKIDLLKEGSIGWTR